MPWISLFIPTVRGSSSFYLLVLPLLILAKTTKCIAPVTSINMCSLNLIFIDENYLLAPSGRRIRKPVRYRADYHETDNVVDDDAQGYYIHYSLQAYHN